MKASKNIECAFGVWKSLWRAVDETGGTLCYSPERVCRLAVATMVLHNICIDHVLQWEATDYDSEEDDTTGISHAATPLGTLVRQSVVENYYD